MSTRRGSFSTYHSRPPPAKQDSVVPFPVFAAHWAAWDMREGGHERIEMNETSNDQSNKQSKQSNKQPNKQSGNRHLGTIMFAGGGGKAGTGVSSGMILTHVTELNHSINQPTNQSTKQSTSQRVCEVTPFARFDTHDSLVTAVTPHPMFDEIAIAAADTASIIHFNQSANQSNYQSVNQLNDQSPSLAQVSSIIADFSLKEPCVESLAISPDGLLLAVGGADRLIRIYRYAPKLKLIGVCGSINPSKLTTVDYNDQQSIKQSMNPKDLHSDAVISLCFNQNSRVLASCAGDGSCKIWDVASCIAEIKNSNKSDDDQTSNQTTDQLNNRIESEQSDNQSSSETNNQTSSQSSHQSNQSPSSDPLLFFPLVGSVVVSLKKNQFAKFQGCCFTGGLRFDTPDQIAQLERLICVVNVSARDVGHTTRLIETQLSRVMKPANNQPNSQLVLVEPMQIISRVLRSVSVSSERLVKMSMSNDDRYIAISDSEGSVFVFDADTFELHQRHLNVHGMPATSLPFAPTCDWLCSASADRTFRFFDLSKRHVEKTKQEQVMSMLMLVLALLMALIAIFLAVYFQPVLDDLYRTSADTWKRYM